MTVVKNARLNRCVRSEIMGWTVSGESVCSARTPIPKLIPSKVNVSAAVAIPDAACNPASSHNSALTDLVRTFVQQTIVTVANTVNNRRNAMPTVP